LIPMLQSPKLKKGWQQDRGEVRNGAIRFKSCFEHAKACPLNIIGSVSQAALIQKRVNPNYFPVYFYILKSLLK
jgi:hypothetical protein